MFRHKFISICSQTIFGTKQNGNNNYQSFINDVALADIDFDIDKFKERFNATAIGNMAYIALNCKNE
jgi:hypothetical protein